MFVFAYGSLLNPVSALRTLPRASVDGFVPARLAGAARALSVAFRNDGTHADKQYLDEQGARPPVVLFWGLDATAGATANGVCIPVDEPSLEALVDRERRYDLVDVSHRVEAYAGHAIDRPVHAFIGKPEHRHPARAAGVVPRAYLDDTLAGVAHWDARTPGFAADFAAHTRMPAAARVRALTRVDAVQNSTDPSPIGADTPPQVCRPLRSVEF